MAHVHDPDLLDALEALETQIFDGISWRVTWASRDPKIGGTGGGRWHPPNSFEALYTSLTAEGAVAESHYHLSKAPIFSSSHVKIHKLKFHTERALIFGSIAELEFLGVTEETFRRGKYARTREIGAAARFLDIDSLVVPNARWNCTNLVVYTDRLDNLEAIELLESDEINWPAWIDKISHS